MRPVSRRLFLSSCAAAAAGALAPPTVTTVEELLSGSSRHLHGAGQGILVVVTLAGGNDGLNTVVPYRSNAYYDKRPEIAIPGQDVLPVDSDIGLHPALKNLSALYRRNRMAVIRGVGYPEPDRSHFRSMDIWQSGSLDNSVDTGWVGRWLDMTKRDASQALIIGPMVPRLAMGQTVTAATLSSDASLSADTTPLISALAKPDHDDSPAMLPVRMSYENALRVSDDLGPVLTDSTGLVDSGESSGLKSQLMTVARCIKADIPTRVYCVTLGGFDTHSKEFSPHRRLLKELDEAVSQFTRAIEGHPREEDVVVMIYSEFGRRVQANASDGTDHGTAGPVFVLGAPVRGGLYGDDPSLTDLVDGDLRTTTDFRDIYHELIATTLATDPEPIVGPNRTAIGFLQAPAS